MRRSNSSGSPTRSLNHADQTSGRSTLKIRSTATAPWARMNLAGRPAGIGASLVARDIAQRELLEADVGGRVPRVLAGAVAPPRLQPLDRLAEHRDQLVRLARVPVGGERLHPGVDEAARGQVLLGRRRADHLGGVRRQRPLERRAGRLRQGQEHEVPAGPESEERHHGPIIPSTPPTPAGAACHTCVG